MASYRNSSVENRGIIFQMSDEMSFSVTPSSVNNNNNNQFINDVTQSPSPLSHQNLRFHLQTQNSSLYHSHILSRHYLGQAQQQQHQQQQHQTTTPNQPSHQPNHQYHLHHQHLTRHHSMNVANNVPLNASEFNFSFVLGRQIHSKLIFFFFFHFHSSF